MLEIKNLWVTIDDKPILQGLAMKIGNGETHALMGPNGSGKSTLAQTLMGHPNYTVTKGKVVIDGQDLLKLEPDQRAHVGVFLSFQYPSEIPGVTIASFLRMVYNKKNGQTMSPIKFREVLKEKMEMLNMDEDFMHRYLNDGFSGGEKKRMEILQMLVLEPKLAILDETDSGLDVDALKLVAKAVNFLKEKNNMSVLLITHYSRVLKNIAVDKVRVMKAGKIVQEGGKDLAEELEERGYAGEKEELTH